MMCVDSIGVEVSTEWSCGLVGKIVRVEIVMVGVGWSFRGDWEGERALVDVEVETATVMAVVAVVTVVAVGRGTFEGVFVDVVGRLGVFND